MTRASVAALFAFALAASLGGAGCTKAKPKENPTASAAAGSSDGASVLVDGATVVDASQVALPATAALSQEDALREATKAVEAAFVEAKQKKPDCDKIVDALDVSFGVAKPKVDDDAKPALLTFATCAKKKERWRLLEQVARALIDADATFKTSFYLSRALVGLGQYEQAARMASGILKAWPKEGEMYTTAALASSRLEDWETTNKQSDQALLIQRQKGLADEITAQAHVFKAEALTHQGKIDESNRELDAAKKIKAYDFANQLRERNDAVGASGLVVDVELASEIYLGVAHLYAKAPSPLGSLATFRLLDVGDKPTLPIRIEVTLSVNSDPVGKAVTVTKGRRVVEKLTPPFRADFKIDSVKVPEPAELAYKITSAADGSTLYEGKRKVTIEPARVLPTFVRVHDADYRPSLELVAAWVTPSAKAVVGVLNAAKKRLRGGEFTGMQAATFPQVQAVWEELRSRGASFAIDPSVDSEKQRTTRVRLPAEVIGSPKGNALEGALVLASLFEAIGLEVVIVPMGGNVLVGWFASKADHASPGAMKNAVPSPLGTAFFVDTTTVGSAPADVAVLRGDALLVGKATTGAFENGSATALSLSKLRKAGIVPQPAD